MTALTDEQMAVLEAQAAAGPLTDEQLGSLQTLEQTPFGQKALPPSPPRIPEKGAVPPPTPPEPLTDRQIRDLEEETYRRPDYIMTPEEHGAYWDRRNAENNEVGRFLSGLGGGAAGLLELGNEAGREMVDAATGFFKSPTNYYKRLAQTGAETFRKSGVGLLMLYDWVGNKIDDLSTGAKRGEAVNAQIREQLQAEGKFTGDRTTDEQIYQAALVEARRAGAYDPTPDQQEEDAQTKYDRYVREKTLEMEFAGVTDFQIGTSKMSAPAATKEAYQITDAEPYEAMSMLGSMVADPLNAIPIAGGAAINLRLMRRMATLSGAPLRGIQKGADKLADAAERAEFAVGSRVQNLTGLTPKQQAAAGAGLAGLMATSGQDRNALGQAVMFAGSVMPTLRYGGALVRRVGATAGAGQVIVREAGVGGLGLARAEAAAELAGNAAIPARYGKYFKGYVDGTDSTLKRVSMNPENPEILRRMARLGDNVGLSAAARTADDFVSGAAVGLAVGAPFAALQPDAERAGEMLGAIAPIAGVSSVGARAVGRGGVAADADIARMLADVQAVGGDAAGLAALPHATLDRMSAMQGVLSGKVDFVPLRADEYRMNVDMSRGGETPAGMFVDRDGTGRARIFINLDANRAAGAVIPHEIGHAILTSNILDGEPRADLRNLVNQQYGPDGVAARGREYAARIVDSDIANGTTGEPPKVMTEAEFRDLDTGSRTPAEVSRGRKMEPAERDRLIAEKMEELEQRSIENGGDRLDWARDEIIAETFASEAPAIDFRGIRRDAMFPRMAESLLSAGGRVLEMMGVRLDQGTGKLMDNPSVLFRENPLFQDRITQKRVREYVRSYDQYLTGLEEAGAKNLRGVELARSNRPEDLSRSTHVKLRDEGRGVLENDFLFQKPDGTYAFKPQKLINAAEANRAAQIKTLYDARKFVPVNSSEFGKRKINGREVIGGPVLPKQFDLFTQFPQHVREFARAMEASRAEGGSWNIDYNAIGTGSSGRYRITNMGAVRAIQRETVPFGWQVTKQNHLLAASLDLNAFRASAMKAINRGELGVFNNDMRQLETDLKTYLANHRNGLPGEAVIGMAKRDMINGLIGTGTAVQRAANPLYSDLNPKGSIRTWRIDRLNDAQPSGRAGYFFDYDKINNNRMPEAIPREAQGMPDAPASGRGDGMPDAPRRYVPMEQFIREAGDDLGEVLANAYGDMDINQDRNALVGFSDTRNSMYRGKIPVKEFFDWLHSDEVMKGLVFEKEYKPATAGEGASHTQESYQAVVDRLRDISLRKPKSAAASRGQAMPDVAHSPNYVLPSTVPARGHFLVGATTVDGRKLEYKVDPRAVLQPPVKDISQYKGENVMVLEADRYNTIDGRMGGPLHPWLLSNQVVARTPDGTGYKAGWANMKYTFVSGARNKAINNTDNGRALIQVMADTAHRSGRDFVSRYMEKVDAIKSSLTPQQADSLHVLLELGARIGQKETLPAPQAKFVKAMATVKSQATRGNASNAEALFKKAMQRHGRSAWFQEIAGKFSKVSFSDEAARFTFPQRAEAMDKIDGLPFLPSLKNDLSSSADFVGAKNLDVVASVQLSQNPDAFAVYFGKNPAEDVKMTATERSLRDQFLANKDFRVHPSYDWMMLSPENADNFILEKPVQLETLFPWYRKAHPKASVQNGSPETVAGAMRKYGGIKLKL
jgi:hypothetical protein